MADNSAIEWTDATWNFLAGCTPVSEGCRNCYAASIAHIRGHNPLPLMRDKYAGTARMTAPGPNRRAVFTGKITIDESAIRKPESWRKPRRIFVNSMSDLFHESVPFEVIQKAFSVMGFTPRHTYQVLTKRPERAAEILPLLAERHTARNGSGWPLPNVWLGTSVENQAAADERIPHLISAPAARRFLSCEPLLGPVQISKLTRPFYPRGDRAAEMAGGYEVYPLMGLMAIPDCDWDVPRIDWVICGGESGHGARPMHPNWARSLRDQCQAAGVAFFFKQWGEYLPGIGSRGGLIHLQDGTSQAGSKHTYEWGEELISHRVGKKAAGRLLDGRTWDEFPAPATTYERAAA